MTKQKLPARRATLRDIADATGLSAVSVHKALTGKPGVSEETRRTVQAMAKKLHYSANDAASALKRSARSIAIVLPAEGGENDYFYRDMWRAVRDAADEMANFNVTLLPCPCDGTWRGQAEALQGIKQVGRAEGVLVANSMDQTALNEAIDHLAQDGVPVITVNSDALGAKRLCCVSAPNERAGRLAAEFMAGGMPDAPCSVALCGAREMSAIHQDNLYGFVQELRALRPSVRIVNLCDAPVPGTAPPRTMQVNSLASPPRGAEPAAAATAVAALTNVLAAPDLYGAYSPSARGTMQLCTAAAALSLRGKCLVGSDVFPALQPYFDSGILRATVWKDPYSQMWQAIHAMYAHLTGRETPGGADSTVRIGLVLRSNLIDYL